MKPKVGVWRAVARLGDLKVHELLWPESVLGVVLGVGGAIVTTRGTTLDDRLGVMGDVLTLSGALLAVVFTALALVVSIPSAGYIREMARVSNGGMVRFLDPFLIAVGTQTAVVLLAFGYKLSAAHVSAPIEHAAFYVAGFLMVFGLLDVVALARSLVRHGLNRATQALNDSEDNSTAAVRHIDERRGG